MLVHMEHSTRMTVIGSLVLVIGTVWYKTNKTAFDSRINVWRDKSVQWD
jgi:hypothetical protein